MSTTATEAPGPASTQDGDHSIENIPAPKTDKDMKAVRFHGKEDLRFEKIQEPTCGKGQIKIVPAWCGICGSDLHEYVSGPNLCPTKPHPITGETVPLTFGHEFSGRIEELGEGVSDKWKVGDRVVVQPIIYDGDCGACKDGLINCCYKNGFVGLSGWGGGLSEHIVVPEYAVYSVPDNVGLDTAGKCFGSSLMCFFTLIKLICSACRASRCRLARCKYFSFQANGLRSDPWRWTHRPGGRSSAKGAWLQTDYSVRSIWHAETVFERLRGTRHPRSHQRRYYREMSRAVRRSWRTRCV